MLWASEHGQITRGKHDRCLENGNLELSEGNFDAFLSLLEDAHSSDANLEPVIKYSLRAGKPTLTMQNYVGVISCRSGTHVEILPKISRRSDPGESRGLLLKMLMELRDSPFKMGTAAQLNAHKVPLFEIFMRRFLEQVVDIARKGIARTYVAEEDNLVYLRGKLKLAEHIRRNSVRADRSYCEYDEYDVNRPINRLIRGALDIVATVSADATNQQICRECLFWFGAVPPTRSAAEDFQRVRRDRLVLHYEPAMPLARLILEGLTPLIQQGTRKVFSILFPMERVFEDYVAAKLPRQFPDWRIRSQVGGKALVERHIQSKMFRLKPDLVLSRGGERVVADTKWKLINGRNRGEKYGISQADLYQLFAYSKKFLADQEQSEVYLIYPATDSFAKPLPAFWYKEGREKLIALPFDLARDELKVSELHPVQLQFPALRRRGREQVVD